MLLDENCITLYLKLCTCFPPLTIYQGHFLTSTKILFNGGVYFLNSHMYAYCHGPMEEQPPEQGFHPDQGATVCIPSRGSSLQECRAGDAKCVLDLLGRMESSSIFLGFCLIRVIKQQDSRFITQESS